MGIAVPQGQSPPGAPNPLGAESPPGAASQDSRKGAPARNPRRRNRVHKDPRALIANLGVRGRVTLMFGLGALLLSLAMGLLSYFSVRHFLVSDQITAARSQAYAGASLARSDFGSTSNPTQTQVTQVADSLYASPGSNSIVYANGHWASYYFPGKSSLPGPLRMVVLRGTPASQIYTLSGSPAVAFGIPIPSVHASYFEVVSLADLSHTLRVLALTLVVVGVVTTVLGAAVGRWASGRSLRPLQAVSRAGVDIAAGNLDTRLPETSTDPDLAGLTTSFNRMVDQLADRIEHEARFTSDVSHELRSPLTTLGTSLDVLESQSDQLPPRARQAVELLGAEIRRFQRMVEELLEISRTDAGSSHFALELVRAGELVGRAVAAHAPSIDGKASPELSINEDVADAILQVDKRRFERIMANLLENADLYGGGATRVTVSRTPPDTNGSRFVRIAVEDHGPGVAASQRQKVFERFYRGGVSGRRGSGTGTGLGLALVADHVRLHGGTTWVEDVAGGGARFVIDLPLIDEQRQRFSDEELA